jgi:predicted PurR-regulated permease PerM
MNNSMNADPSLSRAFQKERQRLVSGALVGLLVLALIHAIYFFRTLLLPIAVAVLFALALFPLTRVLNRFKIPDLLGAIITIVVMVTAAGAGLYKLAEPAGAWVDRVPAFVRQIEFKLDTFLSTIQEAKEASRKIQDLGTSENDDQEVVVKGPSLSDQLYASARSFFLSIGVVIVLLYFILAYGQRTLRRLGADGSDSNLALVIGTIQQNISTYLGTITVVNLFLGFMAGSVMALVGMPNPILWGVVAGLLNYVPYLGPAITTLIFTVVAVLTFDNWVRMALPPVCFLILTILEGQFITPTILGKRLTLNPLLVVLSIFFWGWMWGVPGIVLSLPILSALKSISENVASMAWLRKLID